MLCILVVTGKEKRPREGRAGQGREAGGRAPCRTPGRPAPGPGLSRAEGGGSHPVGTRSLPDAGSYSPRGKVSPCQSRAPSPLPSGGIRNGSVVNKTASAPRALVTHSPSQLAGPSVCQFPPWAPSGGKVYYYKTSFAANPRILGTSNDTDSITCKYILSLLASPFTPSSPNSL